MIKLTGLRLAKLVVAENFPDPRLKVGPANYPLRSILGLNKIAPSIPAADAHGTLRVACFENDSGLTIQLTDGKSPHVGQLVGFQLSRQLRFLLTEEPYFAREIENGSFVGQPTARKRSAA